MIIFNFSRCVHGRHIFVCRLPIEISFTATEQKEVNFNVLCHVKKKTSPLTLNVKAEGYAMNAQLICEDSQGNKVELTSKGTNRINLGMVSGLKGIRHDVFAILGSPRSNAKPYVTSGCQYLENLYQFCWKYSDKTKYEAIKSEVNKQELFYRYSTF